MRIPQGFRPTPAMHYFAFCRAKLGDSASDRVVCDKAGIRPETSSVWKRDPKYSEWLSDQVAIYRASVLDLLEQVALKNIDDFRYWEAMAQKYGYLKPKSDGESDGNKEPLTTQDRLILIQKAKEEQKG